MAAFAVVLGLTAGASAQTPTDPAPPSPLLQYLDEGERLELRIQHLELEYERYDTTAPWVLTFAGAAALVFGGLAILTTGFVDSLNAWSSTPQRDITPWAVTMIAGAAVAVAGLAWFIAIAADRRSVTTRLRAYRHALARLRAGPRGEPR